MPLPALLLVLALIIPFNADAIGGQDTTTLSALALLQRTTVSLCDVLELTPNDPFRTRINTLEDLNKNLPAIKSALETKIEDLKKSRRDNLLEIAQKLVDLLTKTTAIETDAAVATEINLPTAQTTITAATATDTATIDGLRSLILTLGSNLSSEIGRLTNQLAALKSRGEITAGTAKTAEAAALTTTIDAAKEAVGDIKELQTQIKTNETKIAELTAALDTAKADAETLKTQLAARDKELEQLKAQQPGTPTDIQSKITVLQQANDELTQKNKTLEDKIDDLEDDLKDAKTSTTGVGADNEELKSLRQENKTLEAEAEIAKDAALKSADQIKQLKTQLQQYSDELQKAKQQSSTPLSAILMASSLQQQTGAQAAKELEVEKAKTKELTAQLATMQGQLGTIQATHSAELDSLKRQLNDAAQAAAQAKTLEAKVSQLSVQLQQREAELASAKQSVAQTAQLAVLQMGVQSKLNENTTMISELQKQVDTYKTDEKVWLTIETELLPAITAQVADIQKKVDRDLAKQQNDAERQFVDNLARLEDRFASLKKNLNERLPLISRAKAQADELESAMRSAALMRTEIDKLKDAIKEYLTPART